MCYNALWNDIQISVYVSLCISVYEYGEYVVTCAVSSRSISLFIQQLYHIYTVYRVYYLHEHSKFTYTLAV